MSKKENDKTISKVEILPIQLNRNMVLDILSENIQLMNKKVRNNRIRDNDKEKIKVTQMKAVVYACKVYNDILKDDQVDKLEREIEFIKRAITEENTKEEIAKDLEVVEATLEKLNENNKE